MTYLCPATPEHLRPRPEMLRLAEAANQSAASRNAAARKARVAQKSAMERFALEVDRLVRYTKETTELHALKRRQQQDGKPRLAAIRAKLAALEVKVRRPAVLPRPPAPRRHWDLDTLRGFIEAQEARLAAWNRGEVAPSQRTYSIPVCGPDGQVISGASAGFRWDPRQNGWVGFRPEMV